MAKPATSRPTTRPAPAPTSPEIEDLIRRLSHRSWKVREKAQARLAELGEAAEPRLRDLLATTADSQVRLGAQRALLQMEALRKLGPTLVTLKVRNAPLREVFAELSRQGRVPIQPLNENLWKQNRPPVTLDLEDRPFWEAVRRACAAGELRALYEGGQGSSGRIVIARDATREMTNPAAITGSFMVLATRVSRRPVIGAGPRAVSDVDLQLTFYADPKWRIVEHPADTQVESVTDADDRPLPRPEPMHMQAYRRESPIWVMRTLVTEVPAGSGKLRRVKGNFRIVLVGMSEPVEFDKVLSARNVVREVGGQSIQLHEVSRSGDGYQVKLTLTRNGLDEQDWRQDWEAEGIRLLDGKGRALSRASFAPQENGGLVTYEITFLSGEFGADSAGVPAKLICQLPSEPREVTVPFELTDLPVEK